MYQELLEAPDVATFTDKLPGNDLEIQLTSPVEIVVKSRSLEDFAITSLMAARSKNARCLMLQAQIRLVKHGVTAVVYVCGPTAVKFVFRLRLQKISPP